MLLLCCAFKTSVNNICCKAEPSKPQWIPYFDGLRLRRHMEYQASSVVPPTSMPFASAVPCIFVSRLCLHFPCATLSLEITVLLRTALCTSCGLQGAVRHPMRIYLIHTQSSFLSVPYDMYLSHSCHMAASDSAPCFFLKDYAWKTNYHKNRHTRSY